MRPAGRGPVRQHTASGTPRPKTPRRCYRRGVLALGSQGVLLHHRQRCCLVGDVAAQQGRLLAAALLNEAGGGRGIIHPYLVRVTFLYADDEKASGLQRVEV